MNVLVFNGSPKKEKSDTMHITHAFLRGMNDVGPQKVHIIDVIDRHIEFCMIPEETYAKIVNGGV